MTASYKPLFAPTTTRARGRPPTVFFHNLIRETISLPTWLALGAFLQAILLLLPIRRYMALAPATAWLIWQIVNEGLMAIGAKPDVYAARSLQTKFTAVFPPKSPSDDSIETRDSPGGESLCLFILGFSCNHALGPLAPGYKNIVDLAQGMFKELAETAGTGAADSGLLGQTPFFNAGHNTTKTGITTIFYFRSMDDVHRYATGVTHTKAVQWWAKNAKNYPHLGIMHELYQVDQGNWENIYANHEPVLFAATQHPVVDKDGKTQFVSPVVEARTGRLSTTKGRLGRR